MDSKAITNITIAMVLALLSLTALCVNAIFSHYQGNNYFPPIAGGAAILLLLIYLGAIVQFGYKSSFTKKTQEIIYFFSVLSLIALATTAAQFTPFKPIDKNIVAFESFFHINLSAVLAWTNAHQSIKLILAYSYDSLVLQMTLLPLIAIFLGRFNRVRSFYCLLLTTALLSFSFYYFFPTLAPASVIDSPFFYQAQKDTGLKFWQIHNYMPPTTITGGMVALPSFHVIWAWCCLYLVREWLCIFIPLCVLNLLLVASCVFLGWHYPTDLLGSVIILIISHKILKFVGTPSHGCKLN